MNYSITAFNIGNGLILKNKNNCIMKKNIGTIDRVLRIFFAVDIIILYYLETFTGIIGAILLVIGGIFLVTSIFRICPLYTIAGINTCAKEE